ncbi:MAG: PilZ domain-containing protein [Nitratireductor sp.]|nr:PilZ domain-containing protein [Nitratireductor sp.]
MVQFGTRVPAGHNGAEAATVPQTMPARVVFTGDDRRSEHRRRILKAARIVLPGRLSAYDATIRDITSAGARVRAGQHALLPENCELHIPDEKQPRNVRLAWRSGNDAGLVFLR